MFQPSPYAILTSLSALLSVGLAFYAWHRKQAAGAAPMALLMTATGTWAFLYTLELLLPQMENQIAFAKLEYFGIVVIGPAWLLFALSYSGYRKKLSPALHLLLWLPSVVTLALVATNETHHLFWQRSYQARHNGHLYLILEHGPAFWIHAFFSYALLAAGSILLAQVAAKTIRVNRSQAIALLIGILPPWITNVLYLSGNSPVPYLDLSSIALIGTGLILIFGLYRHHLLSIIPVAAETIIETIRDGILVVNPGGAVLNANRAAARLLDIPRQKASDLHIRALFPQIPNVTEVTEQPYEVILKGRYLQIKVSRLDAYPGYRLFYLQDITQARQDALRLSKQNQYLQQLNQMTHIILSSENEEDILPQLVQKATTLFQADHALIVGQNEDNKLTILAATDNDLHNHDRLLALARSALDDGVTQVHADLSETPSACLLKSALVLPLIADRIRLGTLIIGYTTGNRFDTEIRLRGEHVAAQISIALAKIHLLREVRHLAVIDDLTNAYNHRFLNITGQHIFSQAARYGENLSLLIFDLDHFKQINDQYGHLVGDLVLSQIARRSRDSLRESDWLVRYGGDEFIVLLPHTDEETASSVAERLRQNIIGTPIVTTKGALHISISLGIASLKKNANNLDDLIHHADKALYQAKNNGRNQIVRYQSKDFPL